MRIVPQENKGSEGEELSSFTPKPIPPDRAMGLVEAILSTPFSDKHHLAIPLIELIAGTTGPEHEESGQAGWLALLQAYTHTIDFNNAFTRFMQSIPSQQNTGRAFEAEAPAATAEDEEHSQDQTITIKIGSGDRYRFEDEQGTELATIEIGLEDDSHLLAIYTYGPKGTMHGYTAVSKG